MCARSRTVILPIKKVRVVKQIISILIVLFVLTFSVNGFSEQILLTHTGYGSGMIGETAFTNAIFTITGIGDTDDCYSFLFGYWIDHYNGLGN